MIIDRPKFKCVQILALYCTLLQIKCLQAFAYFFTAVTTSGFGTTENHIEMTHSKFQTQFLTTGRRGNFLDSIKNFRILFETAKNLRVYHFWCLRLQNWYFKNQFGCLKHQSLFMKLKIVFWCLEPQNWCLLLYETDPWGWFH